MNIRKHPRLAFQLQRLLDRGVLEEAETVGEADVSQRVFGQASQATCGCIQAVEPFIQFHDCKCKYREHYVQVEQEGKCVDPCFDSESILCEGTIFVCFTLLLSFSHSNCFIFTFQLECNPKFLGQVLSEGSALVFCTFCLSNDIVEAIVDLFNLLLHFFVVLEFLLAFADTKTTAESWERLMQRCVSQRVHFLDLKLGNLLLIFIQRFQLYFLNL